MALIAQRKGDNSCFECGFAEHRKCACPAFKARKEQLDRKPRANYVRRDKEYWFNMGIESEIVNMEQEITLKTEVEENAKKSKNNEDNIEL